MNKIEEIAEEALKKISEAKFLKEVDEIYREYLGKEGKISFLRKNLKNLPIPERKETGKKINQAIKFLEEKISQKTKELKEKIKVKEEFFDVTIPGKKIEIGHLHPLTLVKNKIEEIFQTMGFSVVEGPEIEDEFHNFDALNIPPWHPARDVLSLGKTLFLEEKGYLLRSHTSAVQIRYLEKQNPPLKIIAPGKVFRAEATDASHEVEFWQLEGLMIDKDISVANFKAILEEFFRKFFQRKIEVRLRPSYFPFVEPGFEVDISCPICKKRGCALCKKTGWLETAGAGMVHPQVYKAVKLNPQDWQGFAFGFGLSRLAMLKYKIGDIRLFNSGDLRFIKQFR